jgi:asparagine synthase (glutamine-hydrolysing)
MKQGNKAFLWVQGNHFVSVENEKNIIIGLGHVADDAGNVGEPVIKEAEHDLVGPFFCPERRLEGSFALVILDKTKDEITIYRNIAGLPCIYYLRKKELTLFSDNIQYLIRTARTLLHEKLALNKPQLPYQLLYGRIWFGPQTLLNDIHRVMIGEEVCLSAGKMSRLQRLTLRGLAKSGVTDCARQLEKTMKSVIAEYVAAYPTIVNVFSGGVDSSYIQAHLSLSSSRPLQTISIDLHKMDHEYARSGSEFFDTNHIFVNLSPQEYPKLLTQAICQLGLPIWQPACVSLPKLFEATKKISSVAICGTGGDSLFGEDVSRVIPIAYIVNRVLPFKSLKQILSKVAESLLGAHATHVTLSLQIDLRNSSSPEHPLNIFESKGALETVRRLYGFEEVARVVSQRQAMTDRFKIEGSLRECVSAIHFLEVSVAEAEDAYQLGSWVGLKILFPYLDSRIIRCVLSMRDLRFQSRKTKWVIKEALSKYAPSKLVFRKKIGFGFPVNEWMALGGVLHQSVEESRKAAFVRRKLELGKRPESWAFEWNLLNLNLWQQQFRQVISEYNLA